LWRDDGREDFITSGFDIPNRLQNSLPSRQHDVASGMKMTVVD